MTVAMTPPAGGPGYGLIMGEFGTYAPDVNGNYDIDTRDLNTFLGMGFIHSSLAALIPPPSASAAEPAAPAKPASK